MKQKLLNTLKEVEWIFDYYFAYFSYNGYKIHRYHKYMIKKWGDRYRQRCPDCK